MKGVNLAEWLLRRVTTPEHASAQLGDLLELGETRGPLWFWRAVLTSTAYAVFRPTLAFASAIYFSQRGEPLWARYILRHYGNQSNLMLAGILVLVPLSLVAIFSLIRYGWRDTITRLTFLYLLGTAISFTCFDNPLLRWITPTVLSISLVIALAHKSLRSPILRSLAQLTSAVLISPLPELALITLSVTSSQLSLRMHVPDGLHNLIFAHPHLFARAFLCGEALTSLLVIRVSSRIRTAFAFPANRNQPEITNY